MNVTTFDCNLWNLTSFEKVAYDKDNGMFTVYYFDGVQIEFAEVEEQTVFEFIISPQKEAFIRNVFLLEYPYIQQINKVLKSS